MKFQGQLCFIGTKNDDIETLVKYATEYISAVDEFIQKYNLKPIDDTNYQWAIFYNN